jgi:transcriptional regulator with GAF, ATPase, and Fis domain
MTSESNSVLSPAPSKPVDENRTLKWTPDLSYLVGNSEALRLVCDKIKMVAPTDASVLITGESGSGKELIARAIHEQSNRADQPLVKVNCASIPRELFESEFFGHVKGAFTGAHRERVGRFQMAHGGTLFLDEVGEIPLDLQSKLLRVLQEEQFERVGDDETQQVNVRIIAATNRALLGSVNGFRQDLFYRLSVFPIVSPALRERKEDIPLLMEHFAQQAARNFRKTLPPFTPEIIHLMVHYDWPGNIRELRNVIERAVITSRDGAWALEMPQDECSTPTENRILTQSEMDDFERQNLLRALAKAEGKISGKGGAAELLEVPSSTLTSRLHKMGLDKQVIDKVLNKN